MSFRGRGRGGGGGFRGGGRGRGGRGGGGRFQDYGPPDQVIEIGEFLHPCEEDLVCKSIMLDKVPYFNAPIYLENKSQIGKVDDIFGQFRSYYFSVKLGDGMNASSFNDKQKFFIDPNKLLPLMRFLPRPAGQKGPRGGVGQRGGRGRGTVYMEASQPGGRGGRGGGGRGGGGRGRGGGRGFSGGRGGFGGGRGGFGGGRGGGRGRGGRGNR